MRHDFPISSGNGVIVFPQMRIQALTAIFISIRKIGELSSALIAQNIQRAVAKQAVEIMRVRPGVAREIFAAMMGKISVFFFHSSTSKKISVYSQKYTLASDRQIILSFVCILPVAAEVSQAPVYLTYLQLKFHSDRLAGHFTRFHVPLYAGRAMR